MNNYPWFEFYRVALLELDCSKVPERLALARQRLKEWMQMAGLTANEQHAIVDALNNLHAVEVNESKAGGQTKQHYSDRALETFNSRCSPIDRGVI